MRSVLLLSALAALVVDLSSILAPSPTNRVDNSVKVCRMQFTKYVEGDYTWFERHTKDIPLAEVRELNADCQIYFTGLRDGAIMVAGGEEKVN
jgi:hypothetical protein